jgi:hypothetical protein
MIDISEIEKMQELLEQQRLLLERQKNEQMKREYHGKNILGFKLSRDAKGVWRAFKRINGRNYLPHIGKDPREAEERVREYIEKNGLSV